MTRVEEVLAPDPENPAEPETCCAGLPCDLKVPLEDTLQSTPGREVESSYMHYVVLAREAANRADLLGEELYRQGLEMDVRAEAAREELEDVCGGVVNVDVLSPKACASADECGSGGPGVICEDLGSGEAHCIGWSMADALDANASPEVEQDLTSVAQCLGLGNDPLVVAAMGTKPLYAWKDGQLPLCACNPATYCPLPFDETTGLPTCPSTAPFGATEPISGFFNNRGRVTISETLGFSTDGGAGAGTVEACGFLADMRAGVGDLHAHKDRIVAQPWMTHAYFNNEIADVIDFNYDLYGFLSVTRKGHVWLSNGSENLGPAQGSVFPLAPIYGPAAERCTHAPTVGRPLGCRSLNGTGADRLTVEELARAVQLIQLFGGRRRISVGGYIELPTEFARSGWRVAQTSALPDWLDMLEPSGRIRHIQLGEDSADDAPRAEFVVHDQFSSFDNDLTSIRRPRCLEDVVGFPLLACRPSQSSPDELDILSAWFDGAVLSDTFRKANMSGGGMDNNEKEAKGLFGSKVSWSGWLQRIAEGETWVASNSAPIRFGESMIASRDYPFRENDRRTFTVGEAFDALELACMIATTPGGFENAVDNSCHSVTNPPPEIRGPKDFPQLTMRLRCEAKRIDERLSRMWVPEIPTSVVNAIRTGNVTGTLPQYRGAYNETLQNLQSSLLSVVGSTRTVSGALRNFASDLEAAQSILDRLDRESEILDWRLLADVADNVANCASTFGVETITDSGSAVACANAAVQIASAIAIDQISKENLEGEEKDALRSLSDTFNQRMDTVSEASDQLNRAYTEITAAVTRLSSQRTSAERAAAKVMFLDSDSTGRVYNVNTAMRRRMNTLRIRYEQALADARKMAFIARRSIEMRLGVDLAGRGEAPGAIDMKLALVENPADWVNDSCSMTGINYDRIRDSNSSPVEDTAEDNFSRGYIGDYVTKLENFVESYRFAYPFQDGHDVAMVSLRDDLHKVTKPCDVTGPNLLHWSSDLIVSPEEDVAGWEDASDEGVAVAMTSTALSPRTVDTDGNPWPVPGGTAMLMGTTVPIGPGTSRARWGQEVFLEQGTYLLSWYETPATMPLLVGEAIGLDVPDAVWTEAPESAPIDEFVNPNWSRRVVRVEVEQTQGVRVQFRWAGSTDVPVTWAQPQLELVAPTDLTPDGMGGFDVLTTPKPYFSTTDVLTYKAGHCEDTTGEQFRVRWESGESFCEPICPDGTGDNCMHFESSSSLVPQCYHQISFSIPAGAVERGELGPGLSRTNFNYRYSRVGINLVGTGLLDCEESAFPTSCYSNGFVQYSLYHDGKYTVSNHDGDSVDVDLFPGRIIHAKALAAERFLTTPISSADRALMEDFWREEFRGRPLQGDYTLRIYDVDGRDGRNSMNFDRLEDVQLVFDYNYWTRAQ